MDGFEILGLLPSVVPAVPDLPVLVLTADPSQWIRRRALAAWRATSRKRPFDVDEVLLGIANMMDIRFLTLELKIETRRSRSE